MGRLDDSHEHCLSYPVGFTVEALNATLPQQYPQHALRCRPFPDEPRLVVENLCGGRATHADRLLEKKACDEDRAAVPIASLTYKFVALLDEGQGAVAKGIAGNVAHKNLAVDDGGHQSTDRASLKRVQAQR